MKKLYRKGTVHPSPPPPQPSPSSDSLAFLPAAILALAAALSADDREVLAYLLFCSCGSSPATFPTTPNNQSMNKKKGVKGGGGGGGDHPPAFNCNCFRCYMSYWVRWDSSPNRQLIHEIIDAFEDWVLAENRGNKNKNRGGRRQRSKKGMSGGEFPEIDRGSEMGFAQGEMGFAQGEMGMPESAEHGGEEEGSGGVGDLVEKGSMRKLVNFIGEKIWSFWS